MFFELYKMQNEYFPPELSSRILTSGGRATVGSQLSRGIRDVSSINILETSCRQRITEAEVRKYITNNVTFGFVKDYKNIAYDDTDNSVFYESISYIFFNLR